MTVKLEESYDEGRAPSRRYYAKIDLEPNEQPQRFSTLRRIVVELDRAGVPSDASVQIGYPTAWAQWERPA